MTSEISSKKNSNQTKDSMIWWEKYRPTSLEELCLPKATRSLIEESFQKEIPNLLLCGPRGTGKTTLARILVQDVLKCDYLYINASDENGIDNIRQKVSNFAQTKSFDGGIKVVILDEADFLSPSAMAALRNTMESYLKYTRFILTGNYKHKITPEIQSRCRPLDIKVSIKDVLKRCLFILKQEGITIPNDQKPLIVDLIKSRYPDFRKCIEGLEENCVGGVLNITLKRNTHELCKKILKDISSKDTLSLRKFLIENDNQFGGDYEQLLHDFLNFIYEEPVEDSIKKAVILTTADHIWKMSSVLDKEINAFACFLSIESIMP